MDKQIILIICANLTGYNSNMEQKNKNDYEKLIATIKWYIPEFDILEKQNSWFQKLIGWLLYPFNKTYMTNYYTVMFGKLWVPSGYKNYSYSKLYEILRHEFIHLLDKKKYGILFDLSYLFLFPIVITFRAFWELRAYTQTMLVEYEIHNEISETTIDWIIEQFVTSNYLWMFPFKNTLKIKLNTIKNNILNGTINGFSYPHNQKEK